MEPLRIVFAELPRMLRDILRGSLAAERDIELVGDASSLLELKQIVARQDVDVVILGLTDASPPTSYFAVFEANPHVKILAIADHGRHASLYELRPYRTVLAEASPQELIAIIRRHMRSSDAEAVWPH